MSELLAEVQDLLHMLKVRDPGAVLLASLQQEDGAEARFKGTVRQAATHPYLRSHAWTSPVVTSELLRQISVAVVRTALPVPPENDYALTSLSMEMPGHEVRSASAGGPYPTALVCSVSDSSFREGTLSRADLEIELHNSDGTTSRGRLAGRFFPLHVYKDLRANRRAASQLSPGGKDVAGERVPRDVVHVESQEEVLITVPQPRGSGFVSALVGAANHPYFHHNVAVPDHVPGVMIFEAATQLALAVARMRLGLGERTPPRVPRLSATVSRFIELDLPVELSCEPRAVAADGVLEAHVAVQQANHTCASLHVTIQV